MSRRGAEFDLVVIGGGAGGLSAARAGVRHGARTVLVHDGPIGGDCTFTGCVPSKALIEAAARGATFVEAFAAVHRAVETIARTETADVLEAEGITVLAGRGRFVAPRELDVDGRRVRARRVVVATGAAPVIPPIVGLGDVAYLTNENVFNLRRAPTSLTVLGGGAIGCELAQAFRRLGSAVTVIEALPRLVAREEPEASIVLEDTFAAEGITVCTGSSVTKVEANPDTTVLVGLDDGNSVVSDLLLIAVGRRPVTEGLDLEEAGVETDERGFVKTDDHLATTARGIWAVGDVAGKLQFTHAADEMGRIAVANAFSRMRKRRFNPVWIPSVTYTTPEIGRVGLAEADAVARGGRVAYLPMSEVDRAIVAGQTRGFVKLVAGPRRILRNAGGGQILGATVVAERGGEIVHEAVLAMRTKMFTGRLAEAVHAYPTWSVAIQQAAAQFFMEIGGRSARPARRE
ncbi:MAG: FAD-dependent oxidoreductase [Acidimicrobiia bacterium]